MWLMGDCGLEFEWERVDVVCGYGVLRCCMWLRGGSRWCCMEVDGVAWRFVC